MGMLINILSFIFYMPNWSNLFQSCTDVLVLPGNWLEIFQLRKVRSLLLAYQLPLARVFVIFHDFTLAHPTVESFLKSQLLLQPNVQVRILQTIERQKVVRDDRVEFGEISSCDCDPVHLSVGQSISADLQLSTPRFLPVHIVFVTELEWVGQRGEFIDVACLLKLILKHFHSQLMSNLLTNFK